MVASIAKKKSCCIDCDLCSPINQEIMHLLLKFTCITEPSVFDENNLNKHSEDNA